jgi:hypothetical protein
MVLICIAGLNGHAHTKRPSMDILVKGCHDAPAVWLALCLRRSLRHLAWRSLWWRKKSCERTCLGCVRHASTKLCNHWGCHDAAGLGRCCASLLPDCVTSHVRWPCIHPAVPTSSMYMPSLRPAGLPVCDGSISCWRSAVMAAMCRRAPGQSFT